MIPIKTDLSDEHAFEKSFLVDWEIKAMPTGLASTTMLQIIGIEEGSPVTELPLFSYRAT